MHSRVEANIRDDYLEKLPKPQKMSTFRLISQKRLWQHNNVNTFILSKTTNKLVIYRNWLYHIGKCLNSAFSVPPLGFANGQEEK